MTCNAFFVCLKLFDTFKMQTLPHSLKIFVVDTRPIDFQPSHLPFSAVLVFDPISVIVPAWYSNHGNLHGTHTRFEV